MLNRWINRLVRSEERRRKLLRKPKIAWPSLLQTSHYGKLQTLSRHVFPDRIQLQIELKPNLVSNKDVTATVYRQLNGNRQRMYGRCASIDLIVKEWHAIEGDISGVQLPQHKNKPLYTKEYFTCDRSILDHQTVINHTPVNAKSKCKHIYAYGGYLGPDGTLGDALYMMLSCDKKHTKINIYSYQDLIDQRINLFDVNAGYALQCIDPSKRSKILPLQCLIEQGEIDCELTIQMGDDTWIQTYHSELFVQKKGSYEGFLTLRRKGKPSLRRIS